MTVALPAPSELYFTSENGSDFAAIDPCFTVDATVREEGKTMKGRDQSLAHGSRPEVSAHGGAAGDDDAGWQGGRKRQGLGKFPSSPITLDHTFEIAGDRIVSLVIG
jgi:hypothetical protein